MNRTEVWKITFSTPGGGTRRDQQNSEQSQSCARGTHRVQEPHRVPTSCQSSTAVCPPERLVLPWQQDALMFFSNNPTTDTTVRWSIRPWICSRWEEASYSCVSFSVGFCFFVFQGCWKFSFFKLSILNAIVYRGLKKKGTTYCNVHLRQEICVFCASFYGSVFVAQIV